MCWAKFKELSPILTTRDASYRIKGKIYKAYVQSALTYGTAMETVLFFNFPEMPLHLS